MTDQLAQLRYERASFVSEIDPRDACEAAKGWLEGIEPERVKHAIIVVAAMDPETGHTVYRLFEGGRMGPFSAQGLLQQALHNKAGR